MSNDSPRYWFIPAGKGSSAQQFFINSGCIAVDGTEMEDLALWAHTREAMKSRTRIVFPDESEKTIQQWAGQWFRFMNSVGRGDCVAFISEDRQQVYVGRVSGEYRFVPQLRSDFSHTRSVDWELPRSVNDFSKTFTKRIKCQLLVSMRSLIAEVVTRTA